MAAPVSAAMPTAARDWTASFARRARALGGGEITAILALAGASDVITSPECGSAFFTATPSSGPGAR